MLAIVDTHQYWKTKCDDEVGNPVNAVHFVVKIICPIPGDQYYCRAQDHFKIKLEHQAHKYGPRKPMPELEIWPVAIEDEVINELCCSLLSSR